ncbi:phosphotransferase [Mucilaginibacter sp. BT774]|uniref:phosphotransferase n=1 Tax=Mucilaginibacter sp. BT774 TaxID=3062276 RepID=UPI0026759E4F|nr:phosphotransferase [Mucilaginibacter sp. BT774]MDO3628663.1 phosphotransferase [Mucilaginibacter sp. BT774]
MIPEDKRTVVDKALQAAFGTTDIEDIRQLTAGLSSALVYRIVIQGKPYLLRIIMRTDEFANPEREYNCMRAGAEIGVAPKVWYTSISDRIAITDFVDVKPFPVEEARIKMPKALRKLHSLPLFPVFQYIDAAARFNKKLLESKLMPEEEISELFRQFDRINKTYPRNPKDMVSSHSDLKPENTLYNGEKLWLVDWEAAFSNDRYADLAIAGNFLIANNKDEKEYLQNYFEEEPTEYQHARFFLMQQIIHTFYLTSFVLFSNPQGPIDINMPRSGYREFNDWIWSGEISLADMNNRRLYALVHMDQLKRNLQTDRFEDSLRIVQSA